MTYMSTVKITGNKMGYDGFDNSFGSHKLTHIIDRDNAETPRARASIGVLLLSDEPTLTETLTPKGLDRRLKVDVRLARHIWRQQ